MGKMKYCFLQVSDRLLNPDDASNPADVYFKAIWNHLAGEGYYKPEHFWEIPTWIAELSYCLNNRDNELMLYHINQIRPDDCGARSLHYPVLPDADYYFASVMDCNKEVLAKIVRSNPTKLFYLGGYIGYKGFLETFNRCYNATWCSNIEFACASFGMDYQYGTDYSLFKGIKCIPRLTLSNGCTNHCRFCTVPNEVIETDLLDIWQQIQSMRDLDFELIYINDKTFGQCHNYIRLKTIYKYIKEFNPKFRGFTIQTTCQQICDWATAGIDLKDLHVVNVEIGVESFNNVILRKYRKPQTTQTIDYAVFILKAMNVNIIPNIIIGLPGESLFSYWNTLKWLNDNKQDFLILNIFNFVPYDRSETTKKTNEGLNETVCKRSYHTKREAKDVEMFTEVLFRYGMEIIETTKMRST